jgi:hypothetical protein
VRASRSGEGGCGRDRRHQGPGQRQPRRDATRDYAQIAREILEEAKAVDAAEDELYGEARGDELPPELATAQGRRKWLRAWQRRLDDERAEQARPIPQSRPKRLKEAKRRLEEELWTEQRANEAYEAYRARGVMKDGRRFGGPPKPYQPPAVPQGKINVTDPDSRLVKGMRGWLQGYNAQAATNEQQIVVAAEVTVDSPTSATSNRSLPRPAASWTPPASPRARRSCSPTPATGTKTRWSGSSPTASRC